MVKLFFARMLLLSALFGLWFSPAGWPGGFGAAVARAQDVDPATKSALFLLSQSTIVRRDGRHDQLLLALRHLRDPELEPVFIALADSSKRALQIHGILGLAEISPSHSIELARVAGLNEPALQAELVSAAMDSDVLSLEAAEQLARWPGMDIAVKVLLATRLIEAERFSDTAMLHEAMESKTLGRRALAALLLHQMGDAAGTAGLAEVDQTTDDQRDIVRVRLLQLALRHHLTKAGPWAYAICLEPTVDPALDVLALRTALRFGEARAAALWRQRYDAATDSAMRIRLALTVLRLAPWLEAGLFDVLCASDDPLIRQAGKAGKAIASGGRDVPDQVVALVQMQQPTMNSWALSYAEDDAKPSDAELILLGLILGYEEGPVASRGARLEIAVRATQTLFDKQPDSAKNLLRPILTSPQTDAALLEGILLGLVRSQEGRAREVVDGLGPFATANADQLALLLLTRQNQPLDERQMNDLRLLVRGGGNLEDSLRMQAAWTYLKRTGQKQLALAQVLGSL